MSEVDLDDMSTDATQKQMNDNFSVLTEDYLPEADRSLMTIASTSPSIFDRVGNSTYTSTYGIGPERNSSRRLSESSNSNHSSSSSISRRSK